MPIKQDFERLNPVVCKSHAKAMESLKSIYDSMFAELASDSERLLCMLTSFQELIRSIISVAFETCDNIDDESEAERFKHVLLSTISQVLAQLGHEHDLRLRTQIDTIYSVWPIN